MVLTRGEDDYNYDYDYGNEDDYTYIGETLEEVIITPDEKDEWEIIAPPDSGTIDPEPTEPESTSTEDDTVTENNNGDQNSDEKSVPLSPTEKVEINSLLTQLEKLKNIDRTKYTIEKQNYCRTTARTSPEGILLVCQLFFSLKELETIDKLSTIWHEMYHIDHKHYAIQESHKFASPTILSPPANIEALLREKLEDEFKGLRITPATFEAVYHDWLTVSSYISVEYYQNELETHKAERENFPNVSNFYERERTILEWQYQEMINKINEQSKK